MSKDHWISGTYLTVVLSLIFAFAAGAGHGQSPQTPADGTALFESRIKPILEASCLGCHSGAALTSELDLSTREGLLKGGTRGPAVQPGNAAQSLLYRLVAHLDKPHMPPLGDKLPEDVVAQLAAWIDSGAPYGPAQPAAPTATAGSADKPGAGIFAADIARSSRQIASSVTTVRVPLPGST